LFVGTKLKKKGEGNLNEAKEGQTNSIGVQTKQEIKGKPQSISNQDFSLHTS
jgi:hypothetical protein